MKALTLTLILASLVVSCQIELTQRDLVYPEFQMLRVKCSEADGLNILEHVRELEDEAFSLYGVSTIVGSGDFWFGVPTVRINYFIERIDSMTNNPFVIGQVNEDTNDWAVIYPH